MKTAENCAALKFGLNDQGGCRNHTDVFRLFWAIQLSKPEDAGDAAAFATRQVGIEVAISAVNVSSLRVRGWSSVFGEDDAVALIARANASSVVLGAGFEDADLARFAIAFEARAQTTFETNLGADLSRSSAARAPKWAAGAGGAGAGVVILAGLGVLAWRRGANAPRVERGAPLEWKQNPCVDRV